MKKYAIAGLALCALAAAGQASAADAKREKFGKLNDGRTIQSVVLSNANGYRARVMTLGGALQSLYTPDKNGDFDDIILGFDDPQGYVDNPSYMGATVGRFANRIGDATFLLDGKTIKLTPNENGNQLHGGPEGFDKRVWKIVSVKKGDPAKVTLEYKSADGEEGYPGNMTVRVTYSLSDDNELTILQEATTDAPTVANITNHSYYNLAGQKSWRSVLGQKLTIDADRYTPVDGGLIPTGDVVSVDGTIFDFRKGKLIGEDIHDGAEPQLMIGRGFDHNFVLTASDDEMRLGARVEDAKSGRVLEMYTNQPAIQFYSGNFLDGSFAGKGHRVYRQGDALCLEPQVYPDAPNKPDFPSARLDPGETYVNKIVLHFGVLETE